MIKREPRADQARNVKASQTQAEAKLLVWGVFDDLRVTSGHQRGFQNGSSVMTVGCGWLGDGLYLVVGDALVALPRLILLVAQPLRRTLRRIRACTHIDTATQPSSGFRAQENAWLSTASERPFQSTDQREG